MKLKEHEDTEIETNNLLNLLQHAKKETIPKEQQITYPTKLRD
jgi:hypothetical protein